jgi:pimeloyl-ACP methyl ester carboxylesterase
MSFELMARPLARCQVSALRFLQCSAGLALALSTMAQPVLAQPQVYLEPFYRHTSRLVPGGKPLGSLLASEPVESTVPGSKAWRIAYVSSDAAGRSTVVTGLVAVPEGPVPAGGRPVVAWAHGTTGTAQRCGPSQLPQPAQPLNQYLLPSGTSYSDFGLPAMEAFLRRGYVIVATDYQGLGGPGQHQYAQPNSNGRDVIDAIRAVQDFQPARASTRAVVYGWSQGGGATLGAAGLRSYVAAPNSVAPISILGFVAMAPQDLGVQIPKGLNSESQARDAIAALNAQMGGNVFNFSHLAMFYWGLAAAQPGLTLTDLFTPEAAVQINSMMERKCMHELSATLSYSHGTNYRAMLKSQPSQALAWVKAIKALSPGLKPMAPVVIYWGNNDTMVPPIMHQLYYEAACREGAVVSRHELPGDQTHFSTPAASEPLYVAWVADRFAGKPVADGCGALP